jgi:hypothetical protein
MNGTQQRMFPSVRKSNRFIIVETGHALSLQQKTGRRQRKKCLVSTTKNGKTTKKAMPCLYPKKNRFMVVKTRHTGLYHNQIKIRPEN